LLLIVGYIAVRFEAKYSIPVIIAILHDILIALGIYALLGFEVSSATVAAFLTILGYSLYDTIIVFDRIRENQPKMPRATFSQIVNRSMNEVLTRSLIAGFSTLVGVLALLVFGGETLTAFAIAILVGIISGTYSSLFIASPVLALWKDREPLYERRRRQQIETQGYVPAFATELEVAKSEDEDEEEAPASSGSAGQPAGKGGGA
ncbi:MAG: protein translocase subunit SecF, partial [Solirubrobacterales bacterium]